MGASSHLNSLATSSFKQTTKFSSVNFQKEILSPSYIILRTLRVENEDLDEVAYYEPPHQDLHCLQIQLFPFLVLIELK